MLEVFLLSNSLEDIFNSFEYCEVQSYMNLSLVGIKSSKSFSGVDILPLEKGLDLGLVEINETEPENVNMLCVSNNAVTPLIILDGEEIIGAKQNRISNSTYIIEAKSSMNIMVSCTEAGRWNYTSKHFGHSGYFAESRVRRAKAEDVGKSLKNSGRRCSDQSRVWDTIDDVNKEMNVESETSALRDMYTINKKKLNKYVDHFPYRDGMIGCVILVNGVVLGIELLFNQSWYRDNHRRIVESYVPEAIIRQDDHEKYYDVSTVIDKFISEITSSSIDEFECVSMGRDIRVDEGDIVGQATLLDDNPINASFFRRVES
jgi:hypothetical protein